MHRFMMTTGHDRYDSLYQWSIDESPAFWEALCAFCGVEFETPPAEILARPHNIMDAGWFGGSRLSYAAQLLRHGGDRPAIIFCGEDGARREMSFDELRAEVAAAAAGLRQLGVVKGDRVAGFVPNCPEAVIAMLATTSIGAIRSSLDRSNPGSWLPSTATTTTARPVTPARSLRMWSKESRVSSIPSSCRSPVTLPRRSLAATLSPGTSSV